MTTKVLQLNRIETADSSGSFVDMPGRLGVRVLATLVLANAMEFFDYFAYATFAPFITRTFFPIAGTRTGLLLSFGIFAAGFLSRPIGALIIGARADVIGRKPALLLTSALVTTGTLCLAITPGYSTLGAIAPIALLVCRILQGVAIGGELGPSSAYLIEKCAVERRCLYAGWLMSGQGIGLFCAGACGVALSNRLSLAQMSAWGWRLPFLAGAFLIPLQIYLRRDLTEEWDHGHGVQILSSLGRRYLMQWLIAILMILGGTIPTYVANPSMMFRLAPVSPFAQASFVATMAVGLTVFALSVVGGWLADLSDPLRIILSARAFTIFTAIVIAYYLPTAPNAQVLLLVIVAFAGLSALAAGPTIVVILQLFPAHGRAVSLSITYAIGVALFGGTAPFVVASLNSLLGIGTAANGYLCFSAVLGTAAALIARRRFFPVAVGSAFPLRSSPP